MPIKFKRILVATDFSPAACAAIEYGCLAASAFEATLDVVHVVSDPLEQAPTLADSYSLPADFNKHLESAVRRQATEALAKTCGTKPAVEVVIRHGDPIKEILSVAIERKADLVVLGRHGHRFLERMLMGSVAERVVRESPCPVLTVHAFDADSAPSSHP